MRIGIVGGGLMGLALARELAALGSKVEVLEQNEQVGGLATWHDFGGFFWDRFYHVILPSDRELIQFIRDIGLENELRWRRTYTGFYVDDRLHSISSNLEFLRFPLLSLFDKLRLAWTLVYSSRIDDWKRLETEPVEDWLVKVSGRRTYEKLWRPLLLAKLGDSYRRVSAVFIWSYIKRMFSARDSSIGKEQLGHVSGGYKMVLERLCERLRDSTGTVRTGVTVSAIRPGAGGGIDVVIGEEEWPLHFDKLVCTCPVPVVKRLADSSLLKVEDGSAPVEYLGVVCVVLVTNAPLVPYYVVNIADHTIPFTGIIGMSSVVDERCTGGRFMTYLPKYVLSTDEWLSRDDEDVERQFLQGLKKVLPGFDSSTVESIHVNRAHRVQPLQVMNFSTHVPRVETYHDDLFVLNSAQFLNATLNNNEVIGAVNQFVKAHADQLRPHETSQ